MDLGSIVQKIYQFLHCLQEWTYIYNFPSSKIPKKNETSKISVRGSSLKTNEEKQKLKLNNDWLHISKNLCPEKIKSTKEKTLWHVSKTVV